jgi:uncharacterized protein
VIVGAIGDLHYRLNSNGMINSMLADIQDEADILICAGDLTDNGLPDEAFALMDELDGFPIPILAVLGNHDHEGGQADELVRIFTSGGISILNGTGIEVDQVGFAGVKGFCGGFDKNLIQPFGEDILKAFVKSSIDEAIQLENSLAKLDCEKKVAILHYSPIKGTLEGEPLELYPFLGNSRLANCLDRQAVDVIVHGHAHHGSPFSRTPGNIPVYNVSRHVQVKFNNRPYCLFEV